MSADWKPMPESSLRGDSNDINDTNNNNQQSMQDVTKQLNQASAKHCEEMYWMKLELETMRQEKQLLQDRFGELSKEFLKTPNGDRQRASQQLLPTSSQQSQDLMKKVDKQEKMIRLLHNQVALVLSSGDGTIKTYKDQLAVLMTEKTESQVHLMKQIHKLAKERDYLRVQLQASEQRQRQTDSTKSKNTPSLRNSEQQQPNAGSTLSSDEVKRWQSELHRLKKENTRLNSELLAEKRNTRIAMEQAAQDRKDLSNQLEEIQSEIAVLRSTSITIQMREQIQQDREEAIETLEHAASLWEKADSSIQHIEGIINELTLDDNRSMTEEQERVLSTAETAALVHSQVKVSLMLIELKLRNNLSCLQNDKLYLGIKPEDEALLERLDRIQDDAMTAIEQVQVVLDEQLARLEEDAQDDDDDDDDDENDDDEVGRMPENSTSERRRSSKFSGRRSIDKHFLLEDRISEYLDNENDYSREEIADDGTIQHFVSTKIMDKLQDEVSQILGSLHERNAEIVQLKATVDELTVRERSLMHELRRIMAEQAKIEAAERQRRMEAMKALDTDDDEPTAEDDDDGNGSGFASSVEFSDEEEDYDEITYYEEVIE
jgi:hypothetical protein